MSKLQFTAEDFSSFSEIYVGDDTFTALTLRASSIANARLAEMLKGAKVVYGHWSGVYRGFGESYSDKNNSENTHRALLINIEEIKRSPAFDQFIKKPKGDEGE